jgi:MoaA/NifB/PqqE/SkfB family radical SAM enzyme
MKRRLEIVKKLEQISRQPPARMFGRHFSPTVAILNLPAPYYCSKNCDGCVMEENENLKKEREDTLPTLEIIGWLMAFTKKFGTEFITINGRGDPFHPSVVYDTLGKINYAYLRGIQSYVFTAGQNLDEQICKMLANHKVNVMMSLMGNPFIDVGFFHGRRYKDRKQCETADNLWRLIKAFRKSYWQPDEGLTRLGMNYVVSEKDLANPKRLEDLRRAANRNGIFFICNVDFHPDPELGAELRHFALENSDFSMPHSTSVDGACQMGAGSSLTIAANGDIYRCPYMLEGSDGNITQMSLEELAGIIARYQIDRRYSCFLRKTERGRSVEN